MESLMRRFTIRVRMRGAILVVIALLALIGGVGLLGGRHLSALNHQFIEHSVHEGNTVSQMRQHLGDLRRFEKDQLLHQDDAAKMAAYRQKWAQSGRKMQEALQAMLLGEEDDDNPLARDALKQLQEYNALAAKVFDDLAANPGQDLKAVRGAMDPARGVVHKLDATLESIAKVIDKEVKEAEEEVVTAMEQLLWGFGTTLALSLLVVVPSTLANTRSIVEPMQRARVAAEAIARGDLSQPIEDRGADEMGDLLRSLAHMQGSLLAVVSQVREAADSIKTSSAEVAAGNTDLSSRTEQSASNLQQTASSIEQLTGNVRQSAESAAQANRLAESAREAARRGGAVVQQVVANMGDISTSSRRIADIIGTIDGIAFQTNILALNAAVEAARAGEQGRGFAVVAGEVRSLAQRSASAAREIKALIGASVEKVDSGTKLVHEAGSTMEEIVTGVQRVTDVMGEISAATGEQSQGIGAVNVSVAQLDQMTQQNAALVEQSAAAAESLQSQAVRLAGLVDTFRLAASAGSPAPRLPAAPAPAAPLAKATIERARIAAAPVAPQAAPRTTAAANPHGDDWETF